jgi:hypothetical protein
MQNLFYNQLHSNYKDLCILPSLVSGPNQTTASVFYKLQLSTEKVAKVNNDFL